MTTEVVVLGAEGSGKTSLVQCISHVLSDPQVVQNDVVNGSLLSTIATVGVEMTEVNLNNYKTLSDQSSLMPVSPIILREIGSSIASKWDFYITESRGVVFVIDVSDSLSFAASMILLYEILGQPVETIGGKRVVIVLNKTDLCDSEIVQVFKNMLRIEDIIHKLQGRGVYIDLFQGCCTKYDLAVRMITWMKSV